MTKRLLRSPLLWGLTVVRGLRGMALVASVMALSLYLEKELGLGKFERGFHIGLLIAIGLFAKPAAGYLSDRFGRKQVLVPGLVWSCLMALGLIVFDQGVLFTVTVALLGLFLYPDQPILNAALFDVVGRDVASTGLGVAACASFLMGATAPLIAAPFTKTSASTPPRTSSPGCCGLGYRVRRPAPEKALTPNPLPEGEGTFRRGGGRWVCQVVACS